MSLCHSVYKHKKHDKTCSFCHYMSLCHYVYKHYISIQYVCFIRLCNLHEIRRLQVALKKGLIKHQEGRVLGRRRACSGTMKGLFSKCIERILGLRRVKIVYMSYDSV